MKKKIYKLLHPLYRVLMIVLIGVFFVTTAKAQIINEGFEEPIWTSGFGANPSGTTGGQISITGVTALSTMSYYTSCASFTTALNTNPNSGVWWYSKLNSQTSSKLSGVHSATHSVKFSTSGYIITPLTSSAIVSITFWANLGTTMSVGIATDPNITQPTYTSTDPIASVFSNFSCTFPASGSMTSYSISYTGITGPVRVGFFNAGGSSSYIDDITIIAPSGTPPTIATGTATPSITSATVTATVTPGTLPLLATGIIWSTSALTGTASDTALASKVKDIPAATAGYSDKIGPLLASTTYYAESYVIGLDNSVYFGGSINFTTNPKTVPTPGISVPQILSNKINATGSIIDSGGYSISEKGFIWTTTNTAPSLTNFTGKQYEGAGVSSFSDFIKSLTPNTHYCLSAYATNALGTGYGTDTCFTTAAAVPTLTAIPGTIDFGVNYNGSSPSILSYTLTGADLNGSAITITAPAGFIIATSPSGLGTTTGNTISITTSNTATYTGGTLSATPIYVELPTTGYGTFTGNIIQSGGGVTIPANADTISLTGSVDQSPQDVSNSGTDFWLGFAFERQMSNNVGSSYPPYSGNGANMYVYISGTPGTVVTVEMPLLSTPFSQTVTIPASGFASVTGFPQGDGNDEKNAAGLPDARLYYTGVTNRGIHVYSHSAPISVWLYDYETSNSAGGALIFPTNTWNSNYTVQAYGNKTNDGPQNSFFFVIADQDNTPVYFTPTADILDSSECLAFTSSSNDATGNVLYPSGQTDTVYLNKGQVFNAMGAINSSNFGLDLSGTVVRTDCDKKIAVFGGNGRCLVITPTESPVPTTGSDNMVQQMTPSVAWDTKYFSVPTKSMAHNLFRIYVRDAATQVWINDTTHSAGSKLTGLVTPGNYYVYETSAPTLFESDLPISVTQFMISNPQDGVTSTNAALGNNGSGDPEMIILTGAQQAITSATVYSPPIQDGNSGGAYINIVIPQSGVSSFKLDNLTMVDTGQTNFTTAASYGSATAITYTNAFKPYPADPAYYYATFHVGDGTVGAVHTMSANVAFNGIAYGCANGESYGFNAGTQVKNLSSVQFTNNPDGGDSSATAVRTCLGNTVTLKIALPFPPSEVDSIYWNPEGDPSITSVDGNGPVKGLLSAGKAKSDGSIQVSGVTYYVYSSPVPYTFSQLGNFRIPVTAYGTFTSDCPGEDIENMLVIVGTDQANLTYTASCGTPTVTFAIDTIPMAGTNIIKTIFDFGDGTVVTNPSLVNPSHTYPSNQVYTVKLSTYNSVGCISTDSIQVDFSGGLVAGYTKSTNTVCAGSSITFTDNSTTSGTSGTANKWIWDFGDGTHKDSTGAAVSHAFTTGGKYTVTLTVKTTAGCVGIYTDSVTIESAPIGAFTATPACLGGSNAFTNSSTVPGGFGSIDSAFWNFGDGSRDTTIGLQSATHLYATAGNYTTALIVKSDGGCTSVAVTQKDTAYAYPIAGFKTVVNCANLTVTYTDTSKANGTTITEWDWDLDGNGTIDTITHTAGLSFVHPYPGGNGVNYKPTVTVKTAANCDNTSVAGAGFTIGVLPVPDFTINPGAFCLPAASVSFNNTSTISDGTTNQMSYVWHFADGSSTADSSVGASAPGSATHSFTSATTFNVSITATSNQGCTATSATQAVTVHSLPAAVITALVTTDCLNDSLAFSSNTTSGALTISQWSWNFGDGVSSEVRENPNHEWLAAGTYKVGLVETSTDGCRSDSAFQSITVDALPVAAFTTSVNCATLGVTYTDVSDGKGGTITEWDWDLDGNGSVDTVTHTAGIVFSHPYPGGNGVNYKPVLTVKTTAGCSNTSAAGAGFTIGVAPVPGFTINPGAFCLPAASVSFNNTSTISDGTTNQMSYVWHFADGSATADSSVGASAPGSATHSFTSATTFNVSITATSNQGCTATSATQAVTVHSLPAAVITALVTTDCLNDSLAFNSNTTSGALTISQWSWNFGDGVSSEVRENPNHEWLAAGTYKVGLVETSTDGCRSDSAFQSITVDALPVAAFTTSVNCATLGVTYTDVSDGKGGTITEWDWDLDGNGSVDTVTHTAGIVFSHPYPGGNGVNYKPVLTVKTTAGCSNTSAAGAGFTIGVAPVPGFTINPGAFCLPAASVSFNNTSTISDGTTNQMSYVWHFADGSATADSSVGASAPGSATHSFTSATTFNVSITATSNQGCTATSATQAVTVHSLPTAVITALVTTDCLNDSLAFSSNTTSGALTISQWSWNFGDGVSSEVRENPNHEWLAAGTYKVGLVETSTDGCRSDSAFQSITVDALPVAAFTTSVNCATLGVTYTDVSDGKGGTITEWDWDLDGNGSVDTVTHTAGIVFSHPYPGGNGVNYKPVLTVKTTAGCSNTSAAGAGFTIGVAPVPGFTINPGAFCLPAASVSFNNTSTISDGTTNQMSYVWHFADGSATADSSVGASAPGSATHSFTSATTFNVSITATSNQGCTATSATQAVTVHSLPTAVITALVTTDCLNDSLAFNSNTTSGALTISQWSWNFGDGVSSEVRENPNHEWLAAGTYKVGLVETSTDGCRSDSAFQSITVDALPVAAFTTSVNCATLGVTYTDVSDGKGGTITEWDWDLDGNGSVDTVTHTAGIVFSHPYPGGNGVNYKPVLTVKTTAGCSNTSAAGAGFTIGVAPVPGFTINPGAFCLPAASVSFNNTSTISDGTTNQMSYVWHFADGSATADSSVGASAPGSATHSFTSATTFNVSITATSNQGCTATSATQAVTVHSLPAAVITALVTTDCLNDSLAFNSNTTSGALTISQWSWNFGDGVSSEVRENPNHEWLAAGTYKVGLVETSTDGCRSDSAFQSVTVDALPVAAFTTSVNCATLGVTYTDVSDGKGGTITEWDWDLDGNGSVDTVTHTAGIVFSHPYPGGNGVNYKPVLTVKTTAGCSNTSAAGAGFTIGVAPVPGFTINPGAFCLPAASVSFNNTSTISDGTTNQMSYVWHFADGSATADSSVGASAPGSATHSFTSATTFNVSITATSNQGCTATSATQAVTVHSLPTAVITALVTTDCLNDSLAFSSNTTSGALTISQWSWNFGDGVSSEVRENPNHEWLAAGTYKVGLVETSTDGCRSDSAFQSITVDALPVAAFTTSVNCATLGVTYTDVSDGKGGTITEWDWDLDGNGSVDTVTHTAGIVFSHPYPGGNGVNYKPVLTVKTTAGCSNTSAAGAGFTIGVAPVPGFTINPGAFCLPAASVSFNNTSTISDGTTNQMSYVWHFADGSATADSSVGASAPGSATHSFTSATTFNVSITATSNQGCTATSATQAVTVHSLPAAVITALVTTDCLNDSLAFSSNNTSGALTISQWSWNFGDGVSSEVRENPNHEWLAAGTYKVGLVETSTDGCRSDSAFQSITVDALPVAAFTSSVNCATLGVTYTDVSDGKGGTITEWDWDLDGNGSVDTVTHTAGIVFSHPYPGGNGVNYKPVLTVKTTAGCSNTSAAGAGFTIGVAPVPGFTINPGAFCLPAASVSFNNTSTISDGTTNQMSYVWHFADGSSTADSSVGASAPGSATHSFTSATTFNVSITATSNQGCTATSATQAVTVHSLPAAVITALVTTDCLNDSLAFSSNTTSGALTISQWSWNFGDGVSSEVRENPNHEWLAAGTYKVGLVETSTDGCRSDSAFQSITVDALPVAAFTTSVNCATLGVTYTDVSDGKGGTITEWDWDLDGNGSVDTVTHTAGIVFSHPYPGGNGVNYKPVLTVKTTAGCSNTSAAGAGFTIGVAPVPGFTINPGAFCLPAASVSFNNTSTISDGTTNQMSYVWHFADGSATADSSVGASAPGSATHSFTSATTFNVSITATSNQGCTATSATQAVTVHSLPAAVITALVTTDCLNDSLAFNSNTTSGALTISQWSWNFGDGVSSEVRENPNHEWLAAGTYKVGLVETSTDGCRSDSAFQSITVDALPVAAFTTSVNCATLGVTYTDVSDGKGGTITEWDWDLDGNGSVDTVTHTAGIVFSHPYPGGNGVNYKPVLTVKTTAGCSNTSAAGAGFTIGVAPVPGFTINPGAFCLPAASVSFNNTSTISDGTTNQMSYVWHFADGSATADSSVGASAPGSATHSFTSATTFNVSITATSNQGCTATSATQAVTVHSLPAAVITALVTTDCLNDSLAFNSNTTSGALTISQWSWNFGDGVSSEVRENPNHEWLAAGTYKVGLVETSTDGCRSDSAFQSITVDALPVAAFTTSVNCATLGVTYTDVSDGKGGTITEWDWDLDGNGSVDTVTHTAGIVFSHPYPGGNGVNYKPVLTVKTTAGCSNTSAAGAGFTIGVAPVPGFTINPGAFCLPAASVSFNNTSTISDGTTNQMSYVWHFADGSATADSSVGASAPGSATHSFTSATTFNVSITATSNQGCTATSATQAVTVHSLPTAVITALVTTDCLNDSLAFSSNTTSGALTISQWSWNFGDGVSSEVRENPNHEWLAAGTYKVGLVETSTDGCRSDSAFQSITVDALPVAAFTTSVNCATLGVTYTDVSDGKGGTITEWDWDLDGNGSVDTVTHTAGIVFSHPYPGGNGVNYKPVLTVKTTAGCSNTSAAGAGFTIGVAPVPGFTINPGAFCLPAASVSFNNTSTISDGTTNQMSYVWHFADGSATADSSVGASAPGSATHSFTSATTFNVSITATSNQGCTATSATQAVTVHSLPAAVITALVTTDCLNDSLAFSSNNTSGALTISQWSWNFGDGVSSEVRENPNHEWLAAGTYKVGLVETSTDGCRSDSAFQSITVDALPVAAFTSSVNCATLGVTYTDVSDGKGGTITEWDWDLDGNGSVDTVTHTAGIVFSHPYPGGNGVNYKPVLTVKTTAGCSNTSAAGAGFTIGVAPVPGFTINPGAFCLPAASVSFNNTSTISDGTTNQMSYVWHFADGSATADSSVGASAPGSATHSFTSATTFNVSITATSNQGCTATSATQAVTVHSLPAAVITALVTTDCLNDSLAFSSNTTSGALTISQWSWNFGDGVSSEVRENPNHEWLAAGTYKVGLVETSTDGCRSDSAFQSVTVDALPVAAFTLTNVDCSSQTVTVVDNSNAEGGVITEWDWNFGDGTPVVKNTVGGTVKHVYTNGNGNGFTINLTVLTQHGCTAAATPKSFTIGGVPVAGLSPTNLTGFCLPNASVTFNNTSSISDGTTNAMSYIWHFGDGSPDLNVAAGSAPASETHVYTSTKPDTVILTVNSSGGCTSSATYILKDIYAQPIASISAPSAICIDATASLAGNNSDTITNWSWDFGDNNGSTAQAPSYKWSAANQYRISLIVTSLVGGCKSAPAYSPITINALPVVSFTTSQTLCANAVVAFTDGSSSNVNEWNWDFADGSTSQTQSPSHTYDAAGPYNVTLQVKDVNGCSNSTNNTVVINPLPLPGITKGPICMPGTAVPVVLKATNSGSATINNTTGWRWVFDDNSTATGSPVTYTYTSDGPHSLTLIATSEAGCSDTLNYQDTVYSAPIPKDSILNSSALCSNSPVTILNQSTVLGAPDYGNISKIEIYWNYKPNTNQVPDIVDNDPSDGASYIKQYSPLGVNEQYTIRLSAYSANGCPVANADSVITVYGSPIARLAPFAPVCQGAEDFILTGGSETTNLVGTGIYSGDYLINNINNTVFSPQESGDGIFPVVYTFTTVNGCYDTAMQNVNVYATPSVTYASEEAVLIGDSITLSPTSVSDANLQFTWSPSVYLNSTTLAAPVSKPLDSVTYTITATSKYGCHSSTTTTVQVLSDFVIPNTFTPNNDGINDKWVITGLNKFPQKWVQIFDRYGQLLYDSHDYSQPWDGTYNGHQLPSGTYYYIIELNGILAAKTGYVTILR